MPVIKECGCKYFVVDDGWFYDSNKYLGDWQTSKIAFPYGLKKFSEVVTKNNMIFGIWFEFERVTVGSELYKTHPDWLLTYEGNIIVHQNRAFLDFRKKEVLDYLRVRVINKLKNDNIGYLKIDYNDNIGLGVDNAESYGEGMRQNIEAVIDFIKEIKQSLPNLVLEICASGGMRHEPTFIELADMVSFSDAHDCACGVNIAFNLHRYIPPRKLQIWAVIRQEYSLEDVKFICAKAMLGRMCLSGKIYLLQSSIQDEIKCAVDYYRTLTPIIYEGVTSVIFDEATSYFNDKGCVYLIREAIDGGEKLVYAFAINKPNAEFNIEVGNYDLFTAYNRPHNLCFEMGFAKFNSENCNQWGCVLYLKRKN